MNTSNQQGLNVTDVYLPLPLIPKDKNKNQHVLFRLGKIYSDVKLGDVFDLTNTVFPGEFFRVMVTGFYEGYVLVKPKASQVITKRAIERFFTDNTPGDYRQLSQEDYWLLYPEEYKLLYPQE